MTLDLFRLKKFTCLLFGGLLFLFNCCNLNERYGEQNHPHSDDKIISSENFVDRLIQSRRGLYWEIQHCHKLECSTISLNEHLHNLTLIIKRKKKNESANKIGVRDQDHWRIDTCLMLMRQFPSLEYKQNLIEVIGYSYFDSQTIRLAILALGRLKLEQNYIDWLEKSENDVVRAAAIESKAFSMLLQNNIDGLRNLYLNYERQDRDRWISGNRQTYSVLMNIRVLTERYDYLMIQKNLREKIIYLNRQYFEISSSGLWPIVSDELCGQFAVRKFDELIKSDRLQVMEILREIANNERGQDSPIPFPSIVYIMEDFGLELNDAEKAELASHYTLDQNGWESLYIISDQ